MHTFTLAILLKKHGPCQTKKNKSKPSPKEKTNRSTYGAIQLLRDQSKIQLLFHTLTAANFQRRPLETRRHRWREKEKQTTAAEAALPRDTVAHQSHMRGAISKCNVPSEDKTIAAFRRHAAGFQQASVA